MCSPGGGGAGREEEEEEEVIMDEEGKVKGQMKWHEEGTGEDRRGGR